MTSGDVRRRRPGKTAEANRVRTQTSKDLKEVALGIAKMYKRDFPDCSKPDASKELCKKSLGIDPESNREIRRSQSWWKREVLDQKLPGKEWEAAARKK
jgi:hypothetical protein